MNADFQKEAFAQLSKIQLVFLTIIFVGFAADVSLDKSSLDIAREQLASIKDVTVKWKENETWLWDKAAEKFRSLQPPASRGFKFTFGPNSELVFIELPPDEFQIRPLPGALDVLIQDPSDTLSSSKPVISTPQSLSEFWTAWDGLGEKIWIYTEFDAVDRIPWVSRQGRTLEETTLSKASKIAPTDASLQPVQRLTGKVFPLLSEDREVFKEFEATHSVMAVLQMDGSPVSVFIIVKGREQIYLNGQDALISQHHRLKDTRHHEWRFGAANYTFGDLYSISANFADLPFEKIRLILDSEAERYGERLSLLGVSLPTGQLAVWGLLLVTIVYLYFLIILRGVVHQCPKDTKVVAYPWLGILPGKMPLVASLTGLCFLPATFGVVKCVAIYGLTNLTMPMKIWLTVAAVILVLSTAVVAQTIVGLHRKQK